MPPIPPLIGSYTPPAVKTRSGGDVAGTVDPRLHRQNTELRLGVQHLDGGAAEHIDLVVVAGSGVDQGGAGRDESPGRAYTT